MGTLAHAIGADVARSEDVRRAFSIVGDTYGRLDLLVNAADVRRDAALEDLTEDDWDAVLNLSLKGAFLCSQAAMRLMLKRPSPAIVNVASESGMTGIGAGANYVAAQAGLIGLTKILARDLAPGIRVNCVAAADVEVSDVMEQHATRVGLENDATESVPTSLSHSIAPDEVARACVYLLSSDASSITGQTLVVSGRHRKDDR
jgi:3-oxoacyl-[acyl-carrier protein] reductase